MNKIIFFICIFSCISHHVFSFIWPQRYHLALFRRCLPTTKGAIPVKGLWGKGVFHSFNGESAIKISEKQRCRGVALYAITHNISINSEEIRAIRSKFEDDLDTMYLRQVDFKPVIDQDEIEQEKNGSDKHE